MTTIAALTRLQKQMFKSLCQLEETSKTNPELKPYLEHVRQEWLAVYNDVEARELRAAERKDKGQILFEVFSPKDQYGFEGSHVVRTPHRLITLSWYHSGKPYVELRDQATDKFADDLAKAFKAA